MASGKRTCKICGKEYPYCSTVNTSNKFRWQDVACCVEHGCEYFSKVLAGRSDPRIVSIENGGIVVSEPKPKPVKKTRRRTVVATEKAEETQDVSIG